MATFAEANLTAWLPGSRAKLALKFRFCPAETKRAPRQTSTPRVPEALATFRIVLRCFRVTEF